MSDNITNYNDSACRPDDGLKADAWSRVKARAEAVTAVAVALRKTVEAVFAVLVLLHVTIGFPL